MNMPAKNCILKGKNEMKKKRLIPVVSMIMILTLLLFSGCGADTQEPAEISEPINVACLNGPTGMGMVDLMGK